MDRTVLVAGFAQLWAIAAKMIEEGQSYMALKQEYQFMFTSLIAAITQAEDLTGEELDAIMREACTESGTDFDAKVVSVVRSELAAIRQEKRVDDIRRQASMN